ncbi:class I SAM-dependent methyltransferase [Actinoplanes sp. NPDC049599]|uniref:class I SAM-dependent methyltransferase n=1 Tax=Actinoplanes sp. NPDC049599 TaxID=3363903 RepID=UPI0037B7FF3A
MTDAGYDEIADWYEFEFLPAQSAQDDPLGVHEALRELLGPGSGRCLEVGCGTGVYAADVRALGRTPIGVDLSAGMLRHAAGRLPVARADATRLPFADASLPAVIAMMVHTDMPDYPAVLREVRRVLAPGGVFVHVGVHPCFCGAFADRSDPAAAVIRPGYRERGFSRDSWTSKGVRDKVGAMHFPLADLLGAFVAAGLTTEAFAEGGAPTPITFSVRAR